MVRGARHARIPFRHHGEHPPAARPNLFDVRDDLLINAVLRGDEDDRHEVVDQGDRAVLHLGRRVAFGVNVGDFLQLERALERHREIVPPPEVQHVVGAHHPLRDTLDLRRLGEHLLHQLGQPTQRADHFPSLEDREGPQPPHLERQKRQRDDLARKRLGGRDADLGPGVEVDAPIHLARDGGPDHVHESQRPGPAPLRLTQGRQRVRRLTRLRDAHHERPIVHDGIPIPELGRVFDL